LRPEKYHVTVWFRIAAAGTEIDMLSTCRRLLNWKYRDRLAIAAWIACLKL
jgi:hypothetical protein